MYVAGLLTALPVGASAVPLGTVPNWITLLAVLTIAWVLRKGAAGSAISILQNANRVLEGRVKELELNAKEDAKLIAQLRAHTDISLALRPLIDWTVSHESIDAERFAQIAETTRLAFEQTAQRMQDAFDAHEVRSGDRSERELQILDLIASRLGPDEIAA